MSQSRRYEQFYSREDILKKVGEAYERFKETRTFEYPAWHYGPPKGTLFRVEVEDCPGFGDTAFVEMDSARTAVLCVDMQVDFCAKGGFVEAMGYDISPARALIEPIKEVFDAARGTDVRIIHTRQGHEPDLSDAAFNWLLRMKISTGGIGVGETPPGGLGPILVRGEKNWDIIEELYPARGEHVIDKAGRGAFGSSEIHMILKNLGIQYVVTVGVTTDVCVHTITRELCDFGYWTVLLKDCTAATDIECYRGAIKSIKMQGGIFGGVSDSKRFVKALKGTSNI